MSKKKRTGGFAPVEHVEIVQAARSALLVDFRRNYRSLMGWTELKSLAMDIALHGQRDPIDVIRVTTADGFPVDDIGTAHIWEWGMLDGHPESSVIRAPILEDDGPYYYVVAGYRRCMAMLIGPEPSTEHPDLAMPDETLIRIVGDARSVSDIDPAIMLAYGLRENLGSRVEVHPSDTCRAIAALHKSRSIRDMEETVGLAKSQIDRYLKIASLDPRIMDAWRPGDLSMRYLLSLADDKKSSLAQFAADYPELARSHGIVVSSASTDAEKGKEKKDRGDSPAAILKSYRDSAWRKGARADVVQDLITFFVDADTSALRDLLDSLIIEPEAD